jgi:tripartite-type tricarboxylate transporter receptor subunit TctC
MRKLLSASVIATLSCAAATGAGEYPARPITFVVPFAAGGPTDTLARTIAEPMSAALGQSIIIENVAGAGGSIGVGRVVHAAPDGYTISVGNWSTHVVNGAIYALSYDLIKDLEPIALLPGGPQLIVTKKDLPSNNLGELMGWLTDKRVAVGTAGIGSASHASALFLQDRTGSQLAFVHYRGAGPAMNDLVAGHIDMMFDQSANSLPHVRNGTIKAFAVTNKIRLASAPDIPTVDEAGLPNFYITVWHGLWAPKGTPPDVTAKLNAAVTKVLAAPGLQKRFADLGQDVPEPNQRTSTALAALQKAEISKWWPILKGVGVKAQ